MSTPLNGKPTTVAVFGAMGEAYIARAFLESKGIHCFIKEETGRNYNYARLDFFETTELQVGQSDALKGRTLLIENGYVKEEVTGPSRLMLGLDNLTSKIPLISGWEFEQRVMSVVFLVIIILAVIAALIFRNTLLG